MNIFPRHGESVTLSFPAQTVSHDDDDNSLRGVARCEQVKPNTDRLSAIWDGFISRPMSFQPTLTSVCELVQLFPSRRLKHAACDQISWNFITWSYKLVRRSDNAEDEPSYREQPGDVTFASFSSTGEPLDRFEVVLELLRYDKRYIRSGAL